MKPEIKKLTHQAFMELPEVQKFLHVVIDLLDKDGKPTNQIPAPNVILYCYQHLPIRGTEFIEYYNLDANNREDWYNFIAASKIFLKAWTPTELKADPSKGQRYLNTVSSFFPVDDFILKQREYKKHVDLILQWYKGKKTNLLNITPNTDWMRDWIDLSDINWQLKKSALHYRFKVAPDGVESGIEKDEYREWDDFVSLCYTQLYQQLSQIDKCIICRNLFQKSRNSHVYCSPECRQVPDSRKKSKQLDKIHQELCELIDEWLGPKQESDWIDANSLAMDLSKEFKIGLVYQNDLDSQNISDGLRWQFRDHGISLSDNATSKREGNKWLITNENKTYIAKKEKGIINIIRKTFLLDKRSPARSLGRYLKKPKKEEKKNIIQPFENKLKEEKKIIIQTREKRKNNEYKFLRI